MEWTLNVVYGTKTFELKAELEYHTAQVMRIRVHGSKSAVLLETDYPMHQATGSTEAIQWKIRAGSLGATSKNNAQLLMDIIAELESHLKKDYPII